MQSKFMQEVIPQYQRAMHKFTKLIAEAEMRSPEKSPAACLETNKS